MTTEQRGEIWSAIRSELGWVNTLTKDLTYDQSSARLDKMARDLADKIAEILNDNLPDASQRFGERE